MKNAKWKTILCMTMAIMTMGLLAGCGGGSENAGETAAGSGQGTAADTQKSSGDLLADMAGSGDWQEGERFSGGASDSDIADWVESLGL